MSRQTITADLQLVPIRTNFPINKLAAKTNGVHNVDSALVRTRLVSLAELSQTNAKSCQADLVG